MRHTRVLRGVVWVVVIAVGLLAGHMLTAQDPLTSGTILDRTELPGAEGMEAILVLRERLNEIGQLKGLTIRTWSRGEHRRPARLALCTTYRPEPALAILRDIRDKRLNAEASVIIGNRDSGRLGIHRIRVRRARPRSIAAVGLRLIRRMAASSSVLAHG